MCSPTLALAHWAYKMLPLSLPTRTYSFSSGGLPGKTTLVACTTLSLSLCSWAAPSASSLLQYTNPMCERFFLNDALSAKTHVSFTRKLSTSSLEFKPPGSGQTSSVRPRKDRYTCFAPSFNGLQYKPASLMAAHIMQLAQVLSCLFFQQQISSGRSSMGIHPISASMTLATACSASPTRSIPPWAAMASLGLCLLLGLCWYQALKQAARKSIPASEILVLTMCSLRFMPLASSSSLCSSVFVTCVPHPRSLLRKPSLNPRRSFVFTSSLTSSLFPPLSVSKGSLEP